MSPLHISTRDLLKTYGDDFCTEKQFVNYLSDCSVFEPVSLKTIMTTIINEGYAKGLVDAKNNKENWKLFVDRSIPKIVNRNGFEDTYVSYCFQCLCFGLQLIDNVNENILKKDLSRDWTATETTTAEKTNKRTKKSIPQQQQYQPQQPTHFQQPTYSPQQIRNDIFSDVARAISNSLGPSTPYQNRPFTKSVKKRLIFICAFIVLLISIAIFSIIKMLTYDDSHSEYTGPSYYYYYPSAKNFEVTDDNQENHLYNEDNDKDNLSDPTIKIPDLTEIPDLTDLPEIPDLTDIPDISDIPDIPDIEEPSLQQPQSPHYNSSQLQRKAKEYYRQVKERIMERLDIDEEEMKEKLNDVKEEVKEKWKDTKDELMERWRELRN